MRKSKKIEKLIAVLLIVVSVTLCFLISNKMFTITAGNGNAGEVELMNELYKYGCSVIDKNEDNITIKHYITDEKCPFEIEFLENVSYDEKFNYYLEKVNDNGSGNKKEKFYSINGMLVSKETTGIEYYKYVSYKNNTILYLSTMKPFLDNANAIRSNLGYNYYLNINFEYVIIPVILLAIAISLFIFSDKKKKVK